MSVSLIAKLAAKAASARMLRQFAEADAFDAKVAELCERYGVTLADVERETAAAGNDRVRPLVVGPEQFGEETEERQVHTWQLFLAMMIAGRYGCGVFFFPTRNSIGFVGPIAERDEAIGLFCRLVPKLDDMSRREIMPKQREPLHTTYSVTYYGGTSFSSSGWTSIAWEPPRDENWRTSWLCGAAQAVADKLAAELQAARVEAIERGALIPIGRRKELEDWVKANSEPVDDDGDNEEWGDDDEPDLRARNPLEGGVEVIAPAFNEGKRAVWAMDIRAVPAIAAVAE